MLEIYKYFNIKVLKNLNLKNLFSWTFESVLMNKIWSGEHFLLAKSGFHKKVWSYEHTSTSTLFVVFFLKMVLSKSSLQLYFSL